MESDSIVLKDYGIKFLKDTSLEKTIEIATNDEIKSVYLITDSNLASMYPIDEDMNVFVLQNPGENNKNIDQFNQIIEHMISLNLD